MNAFQQFIANMLGGWSATDIARLSNVGARASTKIVDVHAKVVAYGDLVTVERWMGLLAEAPASGEEGWDAEWPLPLLALLEEATARRDVLASAETNGRVEGVAA